ncbi:hypothetical protein Fcan01_05264 [Folsomia candida]|uniref:Uncharacterized protein n=1 Tax=Folsomia candida TaxID=158441 RepID=A0A226ENS3_FOLCA|nr:hypothetical protein Fcan01_05264 [Folsomia candida]
MESNRIRNAAPEHHEMARELMAQKRAETPHHYIFYLADIFTTSLDVKPCRNGDVPWSEIYDKPGNSPHLYPGYWTSHDGLICMRCGHFKKWAISKVWDKIKSLLKVKSDGNLENSVVCLELRAIVCDDKATAQQAEAFVMLFEIVPDDSPGIIPPFPHMASLDEVTNLPILIPESALKERWIDGTRVDARGNAVHNNWEA